MKKAGIMIVLMALAAMAHAAVTAGLGTGSKLWIEGGSTLHPWSSAATAMTMDVALDAPSLSSGMSGQAPAKVTLLVPVAAMKSEHSGMDKNLQKALGAKQNPNIVFTMKGYKLLGQPAGGISAWGDLSIAGQTKPETINASLSWKGGRAVIDGQQPLLMTDFGVKPPTLMLGTLKVDDRIVVKFHLELEPGPVPAKGTQGAQ